MESGGLGTGLPTVPLFTSLWLCSCSVLFPRKSPPAPAFKIATLPQHDRSLLPTLMFLWDKSSSDRLHNLLTGHIIIDCLFPPTGMQTSLIRAGRSFPIIGSDPKNEVPDTSGHLINTCWMHECSLIGLMTDAHLELLEEPSGEAAKGLSGVG